MENLREQIFQATNDFIATVQQLTQKHAAVLLQETFSSLGSSSPRATATPAATAAPSGASRPRGVKRPPDELEHLSSLFVQFVHANPGQRIEQINKQLGTTTAALALPIRKLISSGAITVKGQKRSTTYFAGKSGGKSSSKTADAPAPAPDAPDEGKSKSRGKSRKKSASPRSRAKAKSKK